MKKFLLAAAMVLVSVGASAQHAVGGLTLQPQVGMTISTFTSKDNAKMKVGLVLVIKLPLMHLIHLEIILQLKNLNVVKCKLFIL